MTKPGMRVAGLDLSLAAPGVAIIDVHGEMCYSETVVYEPDKTGMVKTKSGKGMTLSPRQKVERLAVIKNRVLDVCYKYLVDAVYIEGYAFSRFSSSVTGLAELGGVIRVAFYTEYMNGVGLVPVALPVNQCRRFVVGRGNVKKDETQEWLRQKGFEFDSDDEGDAYVVALTGFYVSNPDRRGALTVDRLEIIDAITSGVKRRKPKRP